MNKARKLSKRKRWVDLQHAIHDPNYEDYSLLDKDADVWLTRLNVPAKYERQDIKTRRNEKPEGIYANNGRKL